jgi:hypothetical protein
VRVFGSKETPEQRAERKAFERWAKDALRRAHARYQPIADSRLAELFLEFLLHKLENVRKPVLTRMYTHPDASVAVELFEIEAGILAELGYSPVSQVLGVSQPSLGGITLSRVYERQSLTVTYERRSPDPG